MQKATEGHRPKHTSAAALSRVVDEACRRLDAVCVEVPYSHYMVSRGGSVFMDLQDKGSAASQKKVFEEGGDQTKPLAPLKSSPTHHMRLLLLLFPGWALPTF